MLLFVMLLLSARPAPPPEPMALPRLPFLTAEGCEAAAARIAPPPGLRSCHRAGVEAAQRDAVLIRRACGGERGAVLAHGARRGPAWPAPLPVWKDRSG